MDDTSIRPAADAPVTIGYKVKAFLGGHWQGLVAALFPLVSILILIPFPPQKYQWCAYCLVVMAVFWVTECVPLPVTSFLPIVIFPLTGVMNTTDTCLCYINDTIVMFLGSLFLAYAVEQSGLHNRLALGAIRLIGYSHYKLLFSMSCITMIISMWITNTAATTMMVPINFAILQVFENQGLLQIFEEDENGELVASDYTTCYFCAATFSASIGGIGTLVGTSTNLVFRGLFMSRFTEAPDYLSFVLFSAYSIPYMIVMQFCMYLCMIYMYFGFLRPNSEAAKKAIIPTEGIEAVKEKVEENWVQLGKVTFWEMMIIALFSIAIIMFFSRSPQIFFGWGDLIVNEFGLDDKKFVRDSATAIFISFLMLLLPSNLDFFKNFTEDYNNLPTGRTPSTLIWTILNSKMPYSFMFLLGGGVALAEAAKPKYSDLNGVIGIILSNLKSLPNYVIVLILIFFTVILTNFASNVAICNVVTPIGMQLAYQIDQNPLWYCIATGYSASYCFCLPVGTPGNLIVQGAAKIPTKKMFMAGVGPTVTTILLSWFFMCVYAPVVWPDLYIRKPTWLQ